MKFPSDIKPAISKTPSSSPLTPRNTRKSTMPWQCSTQSRLNFIRWVTENAELKVLDQLVLQ